MVNLSLFGEPILVVEGVPKDITSHKGMALLAYLATNGQRHHREILATLLWPEHDQASARANLRRTLYRLKQTAVGEWLSSDREHVELQVEQNGCIDVVEFTKHIEEGNLAKAVGQYHGDFLTGFYLDDSSEFEEWATQQRETFRRRVLDALFELVETAKRTEDYRKAIDYAQQQLDIDPLRESAVRQLLAVLTKAGRRNEALISYEQSRQRLASELGVDPEPETVVLFERILAGDLQASVTPSTATRRRHNLLAQTTPFIGRETELNQLIELLTHADIRLVTIVAPGGMGKTRLALAAGEHLVERQRNATEQMPFRDGVFLVDLASVEHPDHILEAIGVAVNIGFKPEITDQRQQTLAHFRRRKILLIMDNFEHLLAGAGVVNELLEVAAGLKILITSRLPLNQLDETRITLGGMDYPQDLKPTDLTGYDAAKLFFQTAQRVTPGFSLTKENLHDVVHICQLVQGMPLGIILAASWTEILDPIQIAAGIRDSLDFLSTDLSDVPERQQSMQAVLAYSWDLMSEADQAVFARLSVFRGGFTHEAAENVAGATPHTLLVLAKKSLLKRDDNGRYRIHELLRQFAEAKLRQTTDADDIYQRHARYFT